MNRSSAIDNIVLEGPGDAGLHESLPLIEVGVARQEVRRSSSRVAAGARLKLVLADGEATELDLCLVPPGSRRSWSARLLDVSDHGIGISSEVRLEIGETITLVVTRPDDLEPVFAEQMQVRNRKRRIVDGEDVWTYGIAYEDVSCSRLYKAVLDTLYLDTVETIA